MKIFHQGRKLNFVDDNNLFVGFDYEGSCCETFGHFFSREIIEDFTPWDVEGDNMTEDDLEGYQFDAEFYKKSFCGEECAFATFKLVNEDKGTVYLTIFNSHNGYYAHGFDFCNGEVLIESDSL